MDLKGRLGVEHSSFYPVYGGAICFDVKGHIHLLGIMYRSVQGPDFSLLTNSMNAELCRVGRHTESFKFSSTV